jgi:hypothetical protein
MILMECPFLNRPVRVSTERERHILRSHDQLAPGWPRLVAHVLTDPDEIRWSASDASVVVFGRWYPESSRGKFVLVVVVLDATGRQDPWVVTAYVARRWRAGSSLWRRS